MSDLGYVLLFLSVGGFLAVHCSQATMREWRAGQASGGKWVDHDREVSPLGFWLVMAGNAFVTLLGMFLLFIGVAYSLAYLGWIK